MRDESRHLVSSGSPYEGEIGFSRAVRVGNRVLIAGTAAIWPDGSCDPDPAVQMRRCLEIVAEALHNAGADVAQVVRTRVYLTDRVDGPAIGREHGKVFGDIRPATAFIVVAGFLDPRWKVEVEAEAVVPQAR